MIRAALILALVLSAAACGRRGDIPAPTPEAATAKEHVKDDQGF